MTGGVFRIVANPMYDGYTLAFGQALRCRNAVYLLLAAESYLLLNRIEARIENARFAGEKKRSARTGRSPRTHVE